MLYASNTLTEESGKVVSRALLCREHLQLIVIHIQADEVISKQRIFLNKGNIHANIGLSITCIFVSLQLSYK